MDIKSLEIKNKTNYDWDDIKLVLIFIILEMFLTQIMIMILKNLYI